VFVLSAKVTVVVAVHNAGSHLSACLDAIKGQTLNEIEVIMVDAASTDETAEIMKGYNKLSPAEQLDFCMARMDKIIFSVTEIIDSALWFAYCSDE
jgi:glycosyltransferase involved in cell wall biosynthesis